MLVINPNNAFAELGKNSSSIDSEMMNLNAKRIIYSNSQGNVHNLELDNSTLIREYVNSENQIYAVTWTGQHRPNLNLLLGSENFNTVSDRNISKHFDHKHLSFDNGKLIFNIRTSNRVELGKAMLVDIAPKNLRIDQIE
jgi:hypothetical protein